MIMPKRKITCPATGLIREQIKNNGIKEIDINEIKGLSMKKPAGIY